jgi:hypothetical protein
MILAKLRGAPLRALKRMNSQVRLLFLAYSECRAMKSDLSNKSRFLREGRWRVGTRYAYHSSSGTDKLVVLFESISPPGKMKGSGLLRTLNRISGNSLLVVRDPSEGTDASVVYRSRTGTLKFFNPETGYVHSAASREDWVKKTSVLECRIFRHFHHPEARWENLSGQDFIVEKLIAAKDLTVRNPVEKHDVFEQLIASYSDYVIQDSLDRSRLPDPLPVFDEISLRLPETERKRFKPRRSEFSDLISRSRFVESHLDFNVANILYDGSFFLLDNDDAGMPLPAFYDVVNVAFNQINYWGDFEWFEILMSPEIQPGFLRFLNVCVDDFKSSDLPLVFLAYFVFLNSSATAERLQLGIKDTKQLGEAFSSFEQLMTGYGLAPDEAARGIRTGAVKQTS